MLLSIMITLVLGFLLLYVGNCFVQWRIIEIESISKWTDHQRGSFLFFILVFCVIGALIGLMVTLK